jgi:hypothetical protein
VRLANLSTRGEVGGGANVLIVGFVVRGSEPKRVLVRAAGPALVDFDVGGALLDPRLELHQLTRDGSRLLTANDDWARQSAWRAVRDASAEVGAFAFDLGGKDAALLVALEPGNYTATVSGVRSDAGVALVEVYEF